ncbi:hypothetical protein D9619_011041 [Psilocybe cf. subviscida]|uniref:Nephrocystin 3-like N-terminal domain-containing protein n=1 Tax=Psilocybe cf. subviscida TaxID=2480587 RepID=A0A8H5F0G8_9AGAR|nr:hypothetical protein D9619_011041 [Psilocybe cf. subviscida]
MSNHMFTGASNFVVSGGNFVSHIHSEKSGLDKLSAAAAHSALHDAPSRTDESRCYQNTRTNVLENLERWSQGICDEGASIYWLHGGAGAGKSAIMQTLTERCVAQGLALGSFFFSRSDPTRNSAEVLIPTLVYQLAQFFPSTMDVLAPIIDRDPLVFKKSLQLLSLLIRPLQYLVELGVISDSPQTPRVFLIDGLDECSDSSQQQAIIRECAAICDKHCIPVKFLIASRPEHAISTSFSWYAQCNRALGTISLSEDADSEGDIRRFLEDQFLKIRLQHPFKKMIRSEWPNLDDIEGLVWKSSSHFIYASTAMKYIWSAKENPVRSLQVVLRLESSRTISPFAELDALYHHILRSAAHIDKVLQILAHCFFSPLPLSASVVSFLLNVPKEDLPLFMVDVAPLVVLTKPQQPWLLEDVVKLLHASLEDFLTDQSRSGSLYVDGVAYLASKLETCFQLLDFHSREPGESDWIIPDSVFLPNIDYLTLTSQIMATIRQAGHLVPTREVLRRHSLLSSYQWRLCYKDNFSGMSGVLSDILSYFLVIHSIKTSEGVTLFRSFTEDFLDIVHSHISLKSAPLTGAIFTLIFTGYPPLLLCKPLAFHLGDNVSRSTTTLESAFDSISTTELASICHSVNNPSERLVVAAEEILEYLFHGESRYRYGEQLVMEEHVLVPSLLDALPWAISRAGISEKIAHYSGKTFRRDICARDDLRLSLVQKCLDEYDTRVQIIKAEELGRRIKNGDANALIEKSRTLYLNTQD